MAYPNTSARTQDTLATSSNASPQEPESALLHVLPHWFQVLQDHGFLGLLVIAQGLVVGNMLASGLVGDTGNPFAGGVHDWLHEATWVALFAAGFIMGGMSVRTSAATFYWLFRHKGMALLNFLGCVLFVTVEIWAGLVARSAHSLMTAADVAALTWAGLAHPTLSISDVLTSVAIPMAAMFWGFSAMKPAVKSAAEIAAEGAAKVAQAKANAAVRQAQAEGLAATFNAGKRALLAREDAQSANESDASSQRQDGDFDPNNPGGGLRALDASSQREDGSQEGVFTIGQKAGPSRKLRTVGQVGGIPAGWLDKAGLVTWVRENLGVGISEPEALAFIKSQSSARQCSPEERVQGRPWIAQKATTLQAARRKWASRVTTQVSGE